MIVHNNAIMYLTRTNIKNRLSNTQPWVALWLSVLVWTGAHCQWSSSLGPCNPNSKLTSSSHNQCIPIEWQFDFTDQCLEVNHKFNCVPQFCNLLRDSCYWANSISSNNRDQLHWLRYQGSLDGLGYPNAELISSKLNQLKDKDKSSSFLFALLDLNLGSQPSGSAPKFNSRTARITTPFISLTNSMCQLSFKYALWTPSISVKHLKVKLELNLLARSRHSNQTRPLWSKSIESQPDQPQLSKSPLEGTQEGAWLTEVLKLGHLKDIELEFEAKSILISVLQIQDKLLPPGIEPSKSISGASYYSLAAFAWIKFQNCVWLQKDTLGQPFEYRSTITPHHVNQTACRQAQFKCSNGICLDKRKLCNVVDDCLSSDKHHRSAEDEAQELCKLVPGRQNFEPIDENLFSSESFWSRAGNWPSDKIKQTTSLEDDAARPQHDHTLKSPDGHFLSLEIPKFKYGTIIWFYLNSPWLQKLDDEEQSCRVKYFYNFVVDGNPTQEKLPYKVYLTLEHILLNARGDQKTTFTRKFDNVVYSQVENFLFANRNSSLEYPGIDFWREANYHLTDLKAGNIFYIRIGIIVEYQPESSNLYHRATLNIDDLSTHFGCGLLQNQTVSEEMKSIREQLDQFFNIDSYIVHSRPHDDALTVSSSSKAPYSIPDRPAMNNETLPAQFEPKRLVVYVVLAIVSIFGLILIVVYVVVPLVERFLLRHDPQSSSLIDNNSLDACELTDDSNFEQVSRYSRLPTISESNITNSVATVLNSGDLQRRLSSLDSIITLTKEGYSDEPDSLQ